MKLVEEVQKLIKEGWSIDDIIAELGKRGIARRTALEYYHSAG